MRRSTNHEPPPAPSTSPGRAHVDERLEQAAALAVDRAARDAEAAFPDEYAGTIPTEAEFLALYRADSDQLAEKHARDRADHQAREATAESAEDKDQAAQDKAADAADAAETQRDAHDTFGVAPLLVLAGTLLIVGVADGAFTHIIFDRLGDADELVWAMTIGFVVLTALGGLTLGALSRRLVSGLASLRESAVLLVVAVAISLGLTAAAAGAVTLREQHQGDRGDALAEALEALEMTPGAPSVLDAQEPVSTSGSLPLWAGTQALFVMLAVAEGFVHQDPDAARARHLSRRARKKRTAADRAGDTATASATALEDIRARRAELPEVHGAEHDSLRDGYGLVLAAYRSEFLARIDPIRAGHLAGLAVPALPDPPYADDTDDLARTLQLALFT